MLNLVVENLGNFRGASSGVQCPFSTFVKRRDGLALVLATGFLGPSTENIVGPISFLELL